MSSLTPRSQNWKFWLSVGAIVALLGGGLVLVAALGRRPAGPAPQASSPAEVYTAAALTAAAQTPVATSTPTGTDTPSPSPSSTDFPQFSFTPLTTLIPGGTDIAANPCNNSIYVSDVTIPDNTVMAPGTNFVKTWAFQNTGTCSWTTSYQLIFVSGDQMGGKATSLTQAAAPFAQVQASVALTAPATQGTYTGYWRLADNQGNGFGGIVFVKIVVSTSVPTNTPTVTATSGATAQPTATRTQNSAPTATNSPAPTATPTSAPSPTDTPTATSLPSPTDTPTTGG